jgi:hypothetical protein
MSHTTRLYGPGDLQAHSSRPLDETVWRAWMKKNLLEERSRAAARTKTVNWICIGVLVAAVVTSSHVSLPYVAAYQAVVRIIIGVGATVMMFDNIRARQHGFTALFGSIVLLFNPLLPAFALPRNETILLASILPFVGSLLWMRRPTQTRRSLLNIGTPQAPLSESMPQFD